MRKINKFILATFCIIILVLGVVVNLLSIGWLDLDVVFKVIRNGFNNDIASKVILVITEILMLFAVIAIFIDDSDKKSKKKGQDVLMQNDNGRLMISRDTIENLVNAVVSKFAGIMNTQTRIELDEENNVIVLVDLTVTEDVVIKELTLNLQNKIKETVKKSSDLEVKEVNVRIKNIDKKQVSEEEVGK